MIASRPPIIYEIGSEGFMQITNSLTTDSTSAVPSSNQNSSSPPSMSPLNSKDDNGNMAQLTFDTMKTNNKLRNTLSQYEDKFFFIMKMSIIVIIILLVAGFFKKNKKQSSGSDEGEKKSGAKKMVEGGIIALLGYWLVKKIFGKDVKGSSSTGGHQHSPSTEQDTGGLSSNNTDEYPPSRNLRSSTNEPSTHRGDNDIPPKRNREDVPPRRNQGSVPQGRDIGGMPPRRNLRNSSRDIPSRDNNDNIGYSPNNSRDSRLQRDLRGGRNRGIDNSPKQPPTKNRINHGIEELPDDFLDGL